jgi:hypothetical protein
VLHRGPLLLVLPVLITAGMSQPLGMDAIWMRDHVGVRVMDIIP